MTNNVDEVFWNGLFERLQRAPEPDAIGWIDSRAGLSLAILPAVPLDRRVSPVVDSELWLVDPLLRDPYHRARPGDLARWQADGRRVVPVLYRERGRTYRALEVGPPPRGRGRPFERHDEHRYPLLRIRDGEVERHHMEGGFEAKGYVVLPPEPPQPRGELPLDAGRVRRAIGHGLDARFADVPSAWIPSVHVERVRGGFQVSVRAVGEGRENSFRFTWREAVGDPRAWLLAQLRTKSLLPGSEEWWD